MTNPRILSRLVAELSARANQPPSETRELVELRVLFANAAEALRFWDAVAACDGVTARLLDHFDTELEPGEAPQEDALQRPFRAVLMKPLVADRVCFLTVEGFANFLAGARLKGLPSVIEVADDFEPFSTLLVSVAVWGGNAAPANGKAVQGDEPRRLARDVANDLVPSSAATWIAQGDLPAGAVPEAFALAAARALPFALVTEAWRQDGEPRVALKGERTVKPSAPQVEAISREDHAALNSAAAWVYGHSDAEVRHVLFVNEAARLWRDEEAWTGAPAARLRSALTQAGVAYGYHLRDKAKEAMKSLVDLRKAVGDEVEKAAGQTRELIGTLWRDFAVAVGALAVRYLAQPSSATSGRASAAILIGTAVFLTYSFGLSVWLNKTFNRHIRTLREDWHERLYGFLGPKEYDALALQPLRRVRSTYRIARLLVGAAYAAVVLLLVYAAYGALGASEPTMPHAAAVSVSPPMGSNEAPLAPAQ